MLTIRRAQLSDADAVWRIFEEVVKLGDTYTFDPSISREDALKIWFADNVKTFVACIDGEIVGTYFVKANQPGLGSHVANAGYMVRGDIQGKGVGRAMCDHSLGIARELGFLAMQFNIVVSTNHAAVALWKKMGFSIVGTLPKAFRHRDLGLVDAYVMHRFL